MMLAKLNWLRGPVQPGVRQVGGLWGRSERHRGDGGGDDGGGVVTSGSSWFRVGVGIVATWTVPE